MAAVLSAANKTSRESPANREASRQVQDVTGLCPAGLGLSAGLAGQINRPRELRSANRMFRNKGNHPVGRISDDDLALDETACCVSSPDDCQQVS